MYVCVTLCMMCVHRMNELLTYQWLNSACACRYYFSRLYIGTAWSCKLYILAAPDQDVPFLGIG